MPSSEHHRRQRVLTIIATACGRDDFDLDSELYADLGVDSYMRIDLALSVEAELGVELPDHAVVAATTVGDVVRLAMSPTSC